jgi:hypothetical protein
MPDETGHSCLMRYAKKCEEKRRRRRRKQVKEHFAERLAEFLRNEL